MEIKEIVSYFLNNDTDILDVSFRTLDDDDEVVRTDSINYSISESYGFDLITETFDFFGVYGDDEEIIGSDKVELDEYGLLVFLNEYYTINPTELPKSEFY